MIWYHIIYSIISLLYIVLHSSGISYDISICISWRIDKKSFHYDNVRNFVIDQMEVQQSKPSLANRTPCQATLEETTPTATSNVSGEPSLGLSWDHYDLVNQHDVLVFTLTSTLRTVLRTLVMGVINFFNTGETSSWNRFIKIRSHLFPVFFFAEWN